jgi:hypothetical protein
MSTLSQDEQTRIMNIHEQMRATQSDTELQTLWKSLSLKDQLNLLPSSRARFTNPNTVYRSIQYYPVYY